MEIKLSKWQSTVWDSPARFKVINVGRRAGKTVVCIVRAIHEAGESKKIIWYVAPTYKQAKLIAWAILKQYMPPLAQAQFNESELICKLKNGSEIHLKGADNPDSLRGTRIDFAIFDEVAFFSQWKVTWEALRPVLIDSMASCWFISTPNGFNHFYDLYNKQNGDTDYKSFHFTSYDNPYISADELDKTRKEMDEQSFLQEIMADFNRPSGTVYNEWNIDHYKPIKYDPNLPLHISLDFGVNDPSAIIWLQPNGGEVSIIDYVEIQNAGIEYIIQAIQSRPYKVADMICGDPAGTSRTQTTGTSPIEEMAKKGLYVRHKFGVRIPDQIRKAHTFIPRLFIDSDRCERFRDVLLNYRYPDKKTTAVNQENETPIHDEWSHGARAFEYWCVNFGDVAVSEPIYIPAFQGLGGSEVGGFSI